MATKKIIFLPARHFLWTCSKLPTANFIKMMLEEEYLGEVFIIEDNSKKGSFGEGKAKTFSLWYERDKEYEPLTAEIQGFAKGIGTLLKG